VWSIDSIAQTEYHRGRDSAVATKIYETGLKKLGKEVEAEYVIHYLKFLISINDLPSAFQHVRAY
jgi:Suppressor of forked protein (Suf)